MDIFIYLYTTQNFSSPFFQHPLQPIGNFLLLAFHRSKKSPIQSTHNQLRHQILNRITRMIVIKPKASFPIAIKASSILRAVFLRVCQSRVKSRRGIYHVNSRAVMSGLESGCHGSYIAVVGFDCGGVAGLDG